MITAAPTPDKVAITTERIGQGELAATMRGIHAVLRAAIQSDLITDKDVQHGTFLLLHLADDMLPDEWQYMAALRPGDGHPDAPKPA